MTLVLSEKDVLGLLNMDDVVASVEEAFRQQGLGNATNYMRTRTSGRSSVQSVMHANLSYLGRAGLKAYIAAGGGVRFAVLLFDSSKAEPLAIMGADHLGRFRTGAASAVATKYLFRKKSGNLAILGSGKQAFTQALAVRSVMSVDSLKVWSPNQSHREEFCLKLKDAGFRASASDSPRAALAGTDVACSITSSSDAFVTERMLDSVSHVNLAGGNLPKHAELSTAAVGAFDTIVVDDIPQGKVEYGDLIQAVAAGTFSWDSAVDLASVVSGKTKPDGKTLFKSGGVALEDVAVASMLHDKAVDSEHRYQTVDLT